MFRAGSAYELRPGGVLLNSRDTTPGAAVTAAVLTHYISPAAVSPGYGRMSAAGSRFTG